jgi:imidazolonepropionase-like amidohydrolase
MLLPRPPTFLLSSFGRGEHEKASISPTSLADISLSTFPAPRPASPSLALTHVTVIDATGSPAQPNMTVIISGGRITEVESSSKVHPPHDGQVIDATGKFLIPGLWDMHAHWGDTDYPPLFLANGVTGVRIMWGSARQHDWHQQSESGHLIAPHLVIASALIDGPKPFWPGSVSVKTEAEAREAVIQSKQEGADFVKVYSFLPREEYFAIVDEAKKQGVPFAGHLPLSVSAEEASRAGQKSFEHLAGLLPAVSSRSDEFFQAAQADLAEELFNGKPTFWGTRYKSMRQAEIDNYSPERAAALFAVFKKNRTWQVPTLTLLRSLAYVDDPAFTNDPRVKYMPPWARKSWTPAAAPFLYGPRTPEDLAFAKKEFQKDLELVGAMQKAGVGILAGTDASNPFCMPGFSLYDELGLLVKAGLTPMQALQTATLSPARFNHQEKDLGTIEKGKIADLLLLDANPLDDISNTRKIDSVIYGGRLFSRSDLDKMLADIEALASRLLISDVMRKTIEGKDVATAIQQYRDLKAAQPDKYDFGENELIGLGYELIRGKKIPESIEVFKLSVEMFPNSYNTWDSLAEAYMDHGDKDLAIQELQEISGTQPKQRKCSRKAKAD